jgi:ubiquitin-like protein Pup
MAQKQSTKGKTTEDEVTTEPKDLTSDVDIDGILDEIDGVLEENAQQFVDDYIQKGGQ